MSLSSDQWKGTPLIFFFCRFWMIVVYRCVAAALMQAIASDAAWQSGQSIGKLSYSRLCSLLRRGCAAVANLTANAKRFLFGVVFFFFFLFFILIFHSYRVLVTSWSLFCIQSCCAICLVLVWQSLSPCCQAEWPCWAHNTVLQIYQTSVVCPS